MMVASFWVRVDAIKESKEGVTIEVSWNGVSGNTCKKDNGAYHCASFPCSTLRPRIGSELRIQIDDMSELEAQYESGKL